MQRLQWICRTGLVIAAALTLTGCQEPPPIDDRGPVAQWPHWGNTEGGLRHSQLTQITPDNVHRLKVAWTYRTGDVPVKKADEHHGEVGPFFQATPIVEDGRMYLCTPTNRVVALDPETGRQIWSYDPELDWKQVTTHFNCRGVTFYRDADTAGGSACATRILTGTLDGRLIALDAANGRPCVDFGRQGTVDLLGDLGDVRPGEYNVTSPPVVIGDHIIVGGHVIDFVRVSVPAGVVRAYDVHTGALAWAWNPLPPGVTDADLAPPGERYARGTPNVWGNFAVDRERSLVFVPTGNPSNDFFGGDRRGLDYYGSSVVALDGATGKVVWNFQAVHHDVWDFDVSAQPVLFDFPSARGPIPAVAQATRQGFIFILDRDTGKPLLPVEERPVPQAGAVPGETLSRTQPFPVNDAYVLGDQDLSESTAWGFTPWDRVRCRKALRSQLASGFFTPPSLQGTVNPVGWSVVNWGGIAIDPSRNVLVVNTMHVPSLLRLIPAEEVQARADRVDETQSSGEPAANDLKKGLHILPEGSRYAFAAGSLLSPFGAPCSKPPWGKLIAIDLQAGKRLWEIALGTTRDVAPFPFWMNMGVPNMGGPIVTASGLAFIAATTDNFIRAFDVTSGKKLWQARLPAGGQAVPITYRLRTDGKQYVAIAAGGHKVLDTKLGDFLIAYALDE